MPDPLPLPDPLSVPEARRLRVCRICGVPIRATGPAGWPEQFGELTYPVRVTLNFGDEFAHTDCLPKPDDGA